LAKKVLVFVQTQRKCKIFLIIRHYQTAEKTMKSSYLSLTILIAFLPALVPTFNIFNVGGKNETLSKVSTVHVDSSSHAPHTGCFFEHHSCSHRADSKQLAFGAELGKFVRDNRIKDANYRIKKVVIDPGHGGKDPGCSGSGTREKEIALAIGLQLGKTLQSHFPGVQFIFTRKTDVFIPLDRRAEIANENDADLFISIHCNNFPKSANVNGSETYVLGLHRAKDNLDVAKRENSAIFYEDNYQSTYDGYDPNSAEGHIILSMFQNAFLEQSISFANKIEKNIKKNTKQRSRGVKQAGFLVLRKTTMPSVLVETGYLSNSKDNRFLDSANGKAQIVNSIAQAFSEYKREVEAGSPTIAPEVYAQTVHRSKNTQTSVNTVPVQRPRIIKSPARKTTAKSGKVKSSSTSLAKQSLIIASKKEQSISSAPVKKANAAVKYKVLLAASPKLVDTDKGPWLNVPYSVQVIKDGSNFKYMAVGFENFEAAVSAKSELRKIGFKEAFLVAYQGGKRIDMKVAMSKTGIK